MWACLPSLEDEGAQRRWKPRLLRATLSTCPSCSQEAECKKEMLDVKFMADTKIADSKRAFELQKSAFSEEVNIKVRSCWASRGWGSKPRIVAASR